jgi:hypothetical protein
MYGSDRYSIELETRRMIEEARRIGPIIDEMASAFPIGFGLMAREIRSWVSAK